METSGDIAPNHFFLVIGFPGDAGHLFALASALINSAHVATINRVDS